MRNMRRQTIGQWFAVAICLLALGATAPAVSAQEEDSEEKQRSEKSYEVLNVELVAPRMDGPPVVVLITKEGKLKPETGTYRTRDDKGLFIENGQILKVSDPDAEIRHFEVATIDEVAVRGGCVVEARLVLKDARGRAVALPDGRFTNEEGATLIVRKGSIVSITPSTPDPF